MSSSSSATEQKIRKTIPCWMSDKNATNIAKKIFGWLISSEYKLPSKTNYVFYFASRSKFEFQQLYLDEYLNECILSAGPTIVFYILGDDRCSENLPIIKSIKNVHLCRVCLTNSTDLDVKIDDVKSNFITMLVSLLSS